LIININIDYEYHCGYAGSVTQSRQVGLAGLVLQGLVGEPVAERYMIINMPMVGFGSEQNRSGSGRLRA